MRGEALNSRGERPSPYLAVFVVVLVAFGAFFVLQDRTASATPENRTPADVTPLAQADNLPSWNPHVECEAFRTTIPYILGAAYPGQSAIGAPYHTNGTSGEGTPTGGIPTKRSLSPPCSITNVTGQSLTAFVQIEGLYLSSYGVQTLECSDHYIRGNGGGPFPNNATLCDSHGHLFALGTTSGFLDADIDQDWMAKGWCGPGISPCDNVSVAPYVSSGSISVDLQGFVYWDGENWELHPLTGVRLSSGLMLYPDASSMQTARNYSASATLRLPGTSASPVTLGVSGCPADTTCAFSPSTGVLRFDSSFLVNTTPASPLGNFDLTITATNATTSTAVLFHLTIADHAALTFRRGDGTAFGETDDLYINSGATSTNYGTAVKLFVDGLDCIGAGTVCKTLIKFPSIVGPNAGQIPASSRIVNATLGMTITNKGKTEDAYQITEAWDEASASWNSFATDGVPGNRGKEFTFAPDHFGRLSVNLTSITQRWANEDVNQGVLLASTHFDGVDYNSSETVRDRPSLRVQFVPPPSPLVLAYDMETLTQDGRMKDQSGNGNHGAITGTTDVSGKVGRGREFNGVSDEVTTALPVSGLDQWTIALWVSWHNGPSLYEHPIGLGVRHDATFWFKGNLVALKTTDASGNPVVDRAISSTITTGIWYHLAATFDGTTVKAYLDGTEKFSVIAPGTTIRASSVRVGTSGSEINNFFNGTIDEIQVYSRALSASEILGLNPNRPPSNGPVLSYDMETLLPNGWMQDFSGHGNHGSIVGTTDVIGKIGRAREFDGNNDAIQSPPVPRLANGTFSLWVRLAAAQVPPPAGEYPNLIGWSQDPGIYVQAQTGRPYLQLVFPTAGIRAVVASSSVSSSAFRHVAATWNWSGVSTTMHIFVDGIEDATPVDVGDAILGRMSPVQIGLSTHPLEGIVDEVLVYDRALSAAEIAALVPHPPPEQGPILFYDMESLLTDGRMRDLSGHGNHGTMSGTTDAAGKVGRAREFDGLDDLMQSLPLQRSANGTFAVWVKPNSSQTPPPGDYPQILAFEDDPGIYVQARTGRPYLQIVFPTGCCRSVVASTSVSSASFMHIAATWGWDGTNTVMRIYVNGSEDSTQVPIPAQLDSGLHAMRLGNLGGVPIQGVVDEVRLYDRVLSSEEIASLVRGPAAAGSTAALVGIADINFDRLSHLAKEMKPRLTNPQGEGVLDEMNLETLPDKELMERRLTVAHLGNGDVQVQLSVGSRWASIREQEELQLPDSRRPDRESVAIRPILTLNK